MADGPAGGFVEPPHPLERDPEAPKKQIVLPPGVDMPEAPSQPAGVSVVGHHLEATPEELPDDSTRKVDRKPDEALNRPGSFEALMRLTGGMKQT